MLTYQEAFKLILKYSNTLKMKLVPLEEGLGLVLAKDLFALESLPNFDNSAVDGYAVCLPRLQSDRGEGKLRLKIQGEIRAGEWFKETVQPGHAVRIFTGAPVPPGAQAVVMQEEAERINGSVLLLRSPKRDEHIRLRGEDVSKSALLVKKGTVLKPAHLALLTAVGYKKIPVHPSPKIAILATGSELLKEGEKLRNGKIYDSNSILLKALVQQMKVPPVCFPPVGDNPREIRFGIRKGLKSDLLIISGGVSVGAYDLVKEILRKEGVREIFWKVAIKPGKPLYFGRKNRTLVFGLPGNPVSVFVTFEEFVKPTILKMMGRVQTEEFLVQGRLTQPFHNGSRLHFVRARCVRSQNGYAITPLKGQGSHMIGSLAQANGLLRVEPNQTLKKNEAVSVKLIQEE